MRRTIILRPGDQVLDADGKVVGTVKDRAEWPVLGIEGNHYVFQAPNGLVRRALAEQVDKPHAPEPPQVHPLIAQLANARNELPAPDMTGFSAVQRIATTFHHDREEHERAAELAEHFRAQNAAKQPAQPANKSEQAKPAVPSFIAEITKSMLRGG